MFQVKGCVLLVNTAGWRDGRPAATSCGAEGGKFICMPDCWDHTRRWSTADNRVRVCVKGEDGRGEGKEERRDGAERAHSFLRRRRPRVPAGAVVEVLQYLFCRPRPFWRAGSAGCNRVSWRVAVKENCQDGEFGWRVAGSGAVRSRAPGPRPDSAHTDDDCTDKVGSSESANILGSIQQQRSSNQDEQGDRAHGVKISQ